MDRAGARWFSRCIAAAVVCGAATLGACGSDEAIGSSAVLPEAAADHATGGSAGVPGDATATPDAESGADSGLDSESGDGTLDVADAGNDVTTADASSEVAADADAACPAGELVACHCADGARGIAECPPTGAGRGACRCDDSFGYVRPAANSYGSLGLGVMAWDPYRHCPGGSVGYQVAECHMRLLCAIPCTADFECPGGGSGSARAVCSLGRCDLLCNHGEACPFGMECFGSCYWPSVSEGNPSVDPACCASLGSECGNAPFAPDCCSGLVCQNGYCKPANSPACNPWDCPTPSAGTACCTNANGSCGVDHDGTACVPWGQCTAGDASSGPCCEDQQETCNGLDDDCDGVADDGDPGGGAACDAPNRLGACRAGHVHCKYGFLRCEPDAMPKTDICDGVDDDCDGEIDEGNPGGGNLCDTGLLGVCENGTTECLGGALVCEQNGGPWMEVCNGIDDDCDGVVDDGTGGDPCSTNKPGVCAMGTTRCNTVNFLCVPDQPESPESCNGLDDDCDGATDDVDCGADYPAAAFVTAWGCASTSCALPACCRVAGCAPGHADVNGDPTDGCEG